MLTYIDTYFIPKKRIYNRRIYRENKTVQIHKISQACFAIAYIENFVHIWYTDRQLLTWKLKVTFLIYNLHMHTFCFLNHVVTRVSVWFHRVILYTQQIIEGINKNF